MIHDYNTLIKRMLILRNILPIEKVVQTLNGMCQKVELDKATVYILDV